MAALIDREPRVSAAAAELAAAHGVRTAAVQADVCDYPAIQRAVETILMQLGRIDHVVFAVGIGSGKYGFPFWNLEPNDWPRVLQVNVVGAANVAHAVAPVLVRQQSGTMLFLASVAG